MDDETVLAYLEGRSPDLEEAHEQLVREGSPVIGPLLRLTPRSLKTVGAKLGVFMDKAARLSAEVGPAEAGRRNFEAEEEVGRPVDKVFFRTEQVIIGIARKQAQEAGETVARFLLPASGPRWQRPDDDPVMWTVAAVHASTEGIPFRSVGTGLLHLTSMPTPRLTKVAVSASLLKFLDELPANSAELAMRTVAQITKGTIWDGLPALTYRVKNEYAEHEHPMDQDVLLAKLATQYLLVHEALRG